MRADMDRLRALLGDAIGVVAESLVSKDERLRFQAALAVLKVVGIDKVNLLSASSEPRPTAINAESVRVLLGQAFDA